MIYFDEDKEKCKITIDFINQRIERYEEHIRVLEREIGLKLTREIKRKNIEIYKKKIEALEYVKHMLR